MTIAGEVEKRVAPLLPAMEQRIKRQVLLALFRASVLAGSALGILGTIATLRTPSVLTMGFVAGTAYCLFAYHRTGRPAYLER